LKKKHITMKFYTNILAICALTPAASAFMVQAPTTVSQPSVTSGTSIASTRYGTGTETGLNTGIPGVTNAGVAGIQQRQPGGLAGPASARTPAPRRGEARQDSAQRYNAGETISTKDAFEETTPVAVQGGSLRTCSFDEGVDRVTVFLKTTGRPLNANVELWQGPDNAPQKMSVYLEDGSLRPFRCTVESPGSSNAIAIRNTGQMEFPLTAGLECDFTNVIGPAEMLLASSDKRTVQGGAVYTTPFPPSVQSVQIMLKSDGRPLNARVELLQGPNNNKQVMEVYTEDGSVRPFYAIVDTPGSGNVVRIVNTATVEFPLTAAVEAYITDNNAVDESYNRVDGGMTWS
jgi:hypothetical protein